MRAITDMRRRNLIRMITRNRSFNHYTMLNSIGRKKTQQEGNYHVYNRYTEKERNDGYNRYMEKERNRLIFRKCSVQNYIMLNNTGRKYTP